MIEHFVHKKDIFHVSIWNSLPTTVGKGRRPQNNLEGSQTNLVSDLRQTYLY